MNYFQCPKCLSNQISVERRPNGRATCVSCRHSASAADFYTKEFTDELAAEKRETERTEQMRKAAPAMYEALQRILAIKRTVDPNLFDIEAIHSIAEAALRAADGGE